MHQLMEIVRNVIETYGYWGIFTLTALEQFIFPILADAFVVIGTAMGLPFKNVLIYVLFAALIGSYIGYFLGKYLGHPVVIWLFGKSRLDKGERFIKKYGVWGVILAGLTPIPFKIVTWTAGIFEMSFWKFTIGVLLGRMPRYILTGYAASLIYKTQFHTTAEMSAIILGTLQGVTEFLPISSSGHLAIMEHFLKLPNTIGAVDLELFDIFLHGGSLLAILIFFWKDWIHVLKEMWHMVTKWRLDKNSLALKLIIGTIPAILAGLIFGGAIGNQFRQLAYIGTFLILIAIFFLYAEWKGKRNTYETVGIKKSLIIGSAQALALIPGISRAGTTIATGMLMGLKRDAAARFSFMLGGIAILAANVYALFSIRNGAAMPDLSFTLVGTFTSFVVSLASISWLLKFLEKHTLRSFSAYLLILGSILLMMF